jgi:hypothetical protein
VCSSSNRCKGCDASHRSLHAWGRDATCSIFERVLLQLIQADIVILVYMYVLGSILREEKRLRYSYRGIAQKSPISTTEPPRSSHYRIANDTVMVLVLK